MVGFVLVGAKTVLRPLCDDDLYRRVEWLNDPETYRLLTGCTPSRLACLTDATRWRSILEADSSAVVFAIDTASGRHIGDVDLHNIDVSRKCAKLTILIGEKSFWSCGYGEDALSTLLNHAFSALGLEALMLRVFAFNTRAIRCYEKCGFRQTGDTSDSLAGAGHEEMYMTATRESFEAAASQVCRLKAA